MNQDREKKGNVPNLRFPEFQGEWKEETFNDICSISTGNKNTQDKIENGTYPFYVRSETIERIDSHTFDGEAILTAGDGVGVGKIFHYVNGKIGVHQRVYILSEFKCCTKYAYYYFSSKFYDRVKRMSAKNSVDSVRRNMIAQMPISIPNQREQEKIASLLSLIDERISTQNKIIEKYESLIKGITHLLFDTQKPNIRLNNIVDCHSSTVTEAEVLGKQGSYPVYGAAGILTYTSYYEVDEDSVLIIKDGSGVGRIQYATGKYSVLGTLNYLTVKSPASLKYIYYYLQTFNFEKFKVGSGIPHIYFKDYGNAQIYLPKIEQQNKIVEILSSFDNKIQTEKRILENLIKQKSSLLANLFT